MQRAAAAACRAGAPPNSCPRDSAPGACAPYGNLGHGSATTLATHHTTSAAPLPAPAPTPRRQCPPAVLQARRPSPFGLRTLACSTTQCTARRGLGAAAAATCLVPPASSARPAVASASRPAPRCRPATAAAALPHRAVLAAVLGPSVCFSQACQEATDHAFLIALSIPLLVAAVALAYVLRPPPKELQESGAVFEDPATGVRFEAPEGARPERDKNGELAFRAISYTPWPVDEAYEGERVRIPVGKIGDTQARTFVFARVLPSPSAVFTVSLPRPLGVVLQYDPRVKRARVVELVEGTAADQRRRLASMAPPDAAPGGGGGGSGGAAAAAVLPGDVLRAVTCTNFVYPTRALVGAAPPERHIVVYGADNQSWASICGALKKGEARDGEVTLVLERSLRKPAAAAAAPPAKGASAASVLGALLASPKRSAKRGAGDGEGGSLKPEAPPGWPKRSYGDDDDDDDDSSPFDPSLFT